MEQSLVLIRGMKALGYRQLIATPHVMSDFYPNTRGDILQKLKAVREAVEEAGIDIKLDAAAEYLMDEHFRAKVENNELLPYPDGKHVLVEFSFIGAPPQVHRDLFLLQTKGYVPILAHPERYAFLEGNLDEYRQLKDYGCRFQLNLLSLTGHYGSDARRCAELLLQQGMIDFLGSDLHHPDHLEEMTHGLKNRSVRRALREHRFRNTELWDADTKKSKGD